MKISRFFTVFLLALLVHLNVVAQSVPVAILSTIADSTQTLTFTFADSALATASNGEEGIYLLNTGHNAPGWIRSYQDEYDGETVYEANTNVTKVIFEPSFASAKPTSTCMWFYGMGNLDSIQGIEYLNTSEVTDMSNMFRWKQKLTSIDVSHFDTRNVTDMACMFEQCHALSSIDLRNFNTSKVTSMEYMFDYCSSLEQVDVSSFNTESVVNMGGMFMDTSLKNIDVSNFNTKNVKYMYGMFDRCDQLQSIDLSNFSFENIEDATELLTECSSLSTLNMGSNDLKGLTFDEEDGYNGEPFNRVGSEENPCTLIINSDFDKSVLGEEIHNGSVSYYKWHDGYFKVEEQTTGIKIMQRPSKESVVYYGLNGTPINQKTPRQGVYIRMNNGKANKVVIKR